MKVEYISARNPQELTGYINRFIQHIGGEPYIEIFQDKDIGRWHAFIIYIRMNDNEEKG